MFKTTQEFFRQALIIVALSSLFSAYSQKPSLNIDSLVNSKTTDYDSVYKLFRSFSRDSTTLDSLLQASKKAKYSFGESLALNQLGIYCRNTSQYDKAIDFHTKAIDIARANKHVNVEIAALNMLGVVYRRMEAVRSALDYHKEALLIADAINPKSETVKKSIAVSLNSMGNIYLAIEQYDLAIERFAKSLKIEKEVNNKLGLAINYHNIGYAKEGLGDLDSALEYYKKSLQYNAEINSTIGKVICNSSIGTILIQKNKNEEAITLISSILEDAKKLRDKFHLSGVYSSLGWAYLNTGDYKNARNYLEKGQELALKYNFTSSIKANFDYLSSLAEKENDYKQALEYSQESKKWYEKIVKEQNVQYVNDIIIKYDTEKISDKLNLLEQEREIEKLKYRKNRNILIASTAVLFLVVVILYVLYRQRYLKNEKRIVILEQDILRSQMNPHFVFNSLNSIKQYIITNEQKNAVYYLNKFAKLMRKILEASKTKEVTLAEELETINLYFSIENIRFSNEIEFTTNIDENLDINSTKIPSLLLQPFVENAIWHGLSSKEGAKKISLVIDKLSDDFISITIMDNGIGREKSAIIKENKVIKRKSVGLSLTKQRLVNFVKNYRNKFSLNFEDLKDSDDNATGTKVILELPLR